MLVSATTIKKKIKEALRAGYKQADIARKCKGTSYAAAQTVLSSTLTGKQKKISIKNKTIIENAINNLGKRNYKDQDYGTKIKFTKFEKQAKTTQEANITRIINRDAFMLTDEIAKLRTVVNKFMIVCALLSVVIIGAIIYAYNS